MGKIVTLDQLENQARRTKANIDGKADQTELANYLTSAEAASTYLGISDAAIRATTADTLTTRRVLTISDNSVTNKGPGVYFSGGANINIKLPNEAIFSKLTATNLVLGTDTSTVEGAMWLEWS